MRRMRVLGSVLGCLVVGSACATTTGGSGSSAFSTTPSFAKMSREQQMAWRDSTYAQAIADVEGPGASISARVSSFAGSRRVRGVFHLDADAYVLVGHIDANGIVRVVFPLDPSRDDGFVTGGKTYQTQEFLAGFEDEFHSRLSQSWYRSAAMSRFDSYDAGRGYLFMIATWRPMRFDRFSSEDSWDSFELADHALLDNPRPAIHELASLLAGENREAYTVKFARYASTQSLYGGDAFGYSAFSAFNYCPGTRSLGWGLNPFGRASMFDVMFMQVNYGYTFTRRGVTYFYNRAMDCYTPSSSGVGINPYGYRIAYNPFGSNPGPGSVTPPKRHFDPEGPRKPFSPRIVNTHAATPTGRASDVTSTGELPASPQYRQRGLITSDDQPVGPGRRQPRVVANGFDQPTRPSIQDMVNRRPASASNGSRASNNGNDWSRAQTASGARGWDSNTNGRQASSRGWGSGSSSDMGRMSAPQSYSAPSSVSAPSSSSAPPASAPPSSQATPPAGSSSSSGRPGTP